MKKEQSFIKKISQTNINARKKLPAVSIIEVILAAAVISIVVSSLVVSLLEAQEGAIITGYHDRALQKAEEGIEAVRNIRDDNFNNLIDGTYGLAVSGSQWEFSGTADTDGFYTREVIISTIDADTKEVVVNVTWAQTAQRDGTVSVMSYLTNWQEVIATGGGAVFRVTEYYLGASDFTGNTYNLSLDQNLDQNYFVILEGSDGNGTRNGTRGPDEDYARISADPFGTGDLSTSGGSNQIQLLRGNAVDAWVGVVKVVECLDSCGVAGFELLDVQAVTLTGTNTSGTDTASTPWSDINQVVLFGGANGSGCSTAVTSNANHNSCQARIYPSGGNTINWARSGSFIGQATTSVMVIEWGSEWTVQRANITGTAGGNGANAVGEYNTATISSVARDNTWVWGTGHTADNGIGDSAEGTLLTLGDGVNQNANETLLAAGQEYTDTKNFEVYALTHPDLTVDYRFKADGNSGDLTLDVTVDSMTDTEKLALIYNGQNGTGTAYPRPIFSSRFITNSSVRAERRRFGQNWPAWIQGINFTNINAPTGGGGDWSVPQEEVVVPLAGNGDGESVETAGNYAYLVRRGSNPDFVIFDVSIIGSPTQVGSISLPGGQEDLDIEGSYAYVASTSNNELLIVDISTPASLTYDTFGFSGGANALAVEKEGNYAYVGRSNGGDEFYVVDVSNPVSASLADSIDIGDNVRDIAILGNYAYLATDVDSSELTVVDITNPNSVSVVGSYDASGTQDAYSIVGFGNTVVIGRTNGQLQIIDVTVPTSPGLIGTYSGVGEFNELDLGNSNSYVFAATSSGSGELQIIDISTPASPTSVGTFDAPNQLRGIAYDSIRDRAYVAGIDNNQEFIIYAPL